MKKGQAAMEFLMTYGWAILVVLAAIAALAYFGVLSPDKILPERCTGTPGVDCLEKASIDASTDTIQVALKNNLGYNINITGISANTDGDCTLAAASTNVTVEGTTTVLTSAATVNNGKNFLLTTSCSGLSEGRVSTDITLTYTSLETGLQNKAGVNLRGRAFS